MSFYWTWKDILIGQAGCEGIEGEETVGRGGDRYWHVDRREH